MATTCFAPTAWLPCVHDCIRVPDVNSCETCAAKMQVLSFSLFPSLILMGLGVWSVLCEMFRVSGLWGCAKEAGLSDPVDVAA